MQLLNPKHWRRAKGFSNGVVAEGQLICVAGQIGWNAEQQSRPGSPFTGPSAG